MSVYYTLDSTRTSTYKSLGGKGVAPSSCLIDNRHKDRAPEDNYGTIGFSCRNACGHIQCGLGRALWTEAGHEERETIRCSSIFSLSSFQHDSQTENGGCRSHIGGSLLNFLLIL